MSISYKYYKPAKKRHPSLEANFMKQQTLHGSRITLILALSLMSAFLESFRILEEPKWLTPFQNIFSYFYFVFFFCRWSTRLFMYVLLAEKMYSYFHIVFFFSRRSTRSLFTCVFLAILWYSTFYKLTYFVFPPFWWINADLGRFLHRCEPGKNSR